MARIHLKRIFGRTLLWALVALAVIYVGDWAVWRVRMATGGGMGSVSVGTMIVTLLKGNKEEYDWGGTAERGLQPVDLPVGRE